MLTFLNTYEDRIHKTDTTILPITKDSPLEYIQYILCMHPTTVSESTLLSLLYHKDSYITYKSCSILTSLYEYSECKKEYIVYYKYMLKEEITYEEKKFLLNCFLSFISCKSTPNVNITNRLSKVINDKSFITLLLDLLSIKELQYNILLILYIFSFDVQYTTFLATFLKSIISLLKDRSRQKSIRASYLVIVNLLKHDTPLSIGIIDELRKVTHTLINTNVGDIAVLEDMKIAQNYLLIRHSKYDFKMFIRDLYEGRLEDHDFHYDESFWQGGLDEIVRNKVELIKIYKKYIKSHNIEWVILACNDLYMLVKTYPEINIYISKYKVRDVLFDLTKSDNDDIRFKSVQALYACIFTEWN